MGARFVWLGGWPQGLGAAGGGAEFLNLYGRLPLRGKWSIFDHFWSKIDHPQGGSGPGAACGGRGLFGRLVCPFLGFLAKIGAKKGVIYHLPSAPFLGPILAVCPTIFGPFWPNFVGAQKSSVFGRFCQGRLFWCWSGVSFLAEGLRPSIGSTCRVLATFLSAIFDFFVENTTRRGRRRFFGLEKGQNYRRLGDFCYEF